MDLEIDQKTLTAGNEMKSFFRTISGVVWLMEFHGSQIPLLYF